jgi:mycoredoxin
VSAYDAQPDRPTMFTTTWCGYCARLKGQLKRSGIEYTEVDIEAHPDAADIVASVNAGNLTVPTLLFSDGSAMTNPSASQVDRKLAELR